MKIPFVGRKVSLDARTIARVLGKRGAMNPTQDQPPSGYGSRVLDPTQDNHGLIPEYRLLYFSNALVKSGVQNVARQSVQTGPRVVTVNRDDGERFMEIRPVRTAPYTTLADWLTTLAVTLMVDGELFLVPDGAQNVLGETRPAFRVLDASRIQGVSTPSAPTEIVGWRDVQTGEIYNMNAVLHIFEWETPGQFRGVSALDAAIVPAQALDAARRALVSAFTEYGKLPGIWTLPEDFWESLEPAPAALETDEERKAREERNDALLDKTLRLGSGSTPMVHEGTTYTPINRSGDAFMRVFPEYQRLKTSELARAIGVPDHIVSGLVRDGNYSSLKLAHTEAKSRYTAMQRLLESVIRWCYDVAYPGGSRITAIHWPPQPPLDAQKELGALAMATGARLMSHETAMLIQGLDYNQELDRMENWTDEAERRDIGVPQPVYPAGPVDQETER